jgi:predicted HAD superfamily Cof-like phosphohydrolase
MPKTSYEMVREQHEAWDAPIADVPGPIPAARLRLRFNLICEEVAELLSAMAGFDEQEAKAWIEEFETIAAEMWANRREDQIDLVQLADGACDSHVVISGTMVEFGIPEDEVYAEVHRANVDKGMGPRREDGKVLKPEGWRPPDVKSIIEAAQRRAS